MTTFGAWTLWLIALVVLAFGLATRPPLDPFSTLALVASVVAAFTLVTSGAALITRLPRNQIGWLLWAGGLLFTLANSAGGLADQLVSRSVEGARWIIWLGGLAWVPAFVCVAVLVPLLFPTGHLPSPRWRAVVIVGVMAIVLSAIQSAFSPFAPGNAPVGISNSLALGGAIGSLLPLLGGAASLAGVVCLPLVAASLVIRYRRASGIERAQLKWFAAVGAIIGLAFAVGIATGGEPDGVGAVVGYIAWLATFVGLALLPVAIGIAILRYRLYDIDLIIRRTAVYVPLTAILAGLYAASIALLQRLFISATGGPSDGAVILSTLILATTFTPIRAWLQGIVDRRFRDAQDAERQLNAFVDRLAVAEWDPSPARTMRAFLGVCIQALHASGGAAYVGPAVDERLASQTPTRTGHPTIDLHVEMAGQRIGRLELDSSADGRPYGDRDIELIQDAGERVAMAVLELSDIPRAMENLHPARNLAVARDSD